MQSYAMTRVNPYDRDTIGVTINAYGTPNYGSIAEYRYQFYRQLSNVPSSTILLTEVDAENGNEAQGNGRGVFNPDFQMRSTSNGTQDNLVLPKMNYGSTLHGQFKSANYLFTDGHVKFHKFDDTNLIGQGTIDYPKGAWTIDPAD